MWQRYDGNGRIDAQNLYCAANGLLIKEMADKGVVDCVFHRFPAPHPIGHCEFRWGETVTSGYEFLTASEKQVYDIRVGGVDLVECNRHAPFGWRSDVYQKSKAFSELIADAHTLDDNEMYYF